LWLGSYLRSKVGEIEVSVKGVDGMNLDGYTRQLEEPILKENKRIGIVLSIEEIKKDVGERWRALARLLEDDKEDWKKLIPGRVVCHRFANTAGINPGRFKTLYIHTAKEAGLAPFDEIIEIFKSFELVASK